MFYKAGEMFPLDIRMSPRSNKCHQQDESDQSRELHINQNNLFNNLLSVDKSSFLKLIVYFIVSFFPQCF